MLRDNTLIDCPDELIKEVLGSTVAVHRELGPGLLESIYEQALLYELHSKGLFIENQVEIPVLYKGQQLGNGFRADVIVEKRLLLELKSVDSLFPVHTAQLITYLKLTGLKRGFLINFNEKLVKNGIKRISI